MILLIVYFYGGVLLLVVTAFAVLQTVPWAVGLGVDALRGEWVDAEQVASVPLVSERTPGVTTT